MNFLNQLHKIIEQEASKSIADSTIEKIKGSLSGEVVYIALDGKKARNDEVLKMHESGLTVAELSARYFLTSRTIRKIIKKPLDAI